MARTPKRVASASRSGCQEVVPDCSATVARRDGAKVDAVDTELVEDGADQTGAAALRVVKVDRADGRPPPDVDHRHRDDLRLTTKPAWATPRRPAAMTVFQRQ